MLTMSRLLVMIPPLFKQFWMPTSGGNIFSKNKMFVSHLLCGLFWIY